MDGTLALAGIPPEPLHIDPMSLIVGEKRLVGTGSAGRQSVVNHFIAPAKSA